MNYSSSFQDAMIQVGKNWVRASQIESIKEDPGPSDNNTKVTITMLSGANFTVLMGKGGAEDIARKAVGL